MGSMVVVMGVVLCVNDLMSVGVMKFGIFEKLLVVMCWFVLSMYGLLKCFSMMLW